MKEYATLPGVEIAVVNTDPERVRDTEVRPAEMVQVQAVMDAIYASAAAGREVEVGEC